jgi:hypothetical protein
MYSTKEANKMTSWKMRAREVKEENAANSQFLKFKGGFIGTIRFDGPAKERVFKGEDGKEKPSFEFPLTLFRMMKRNDEGELVPVKGFPNTAEGEEKELGVTSMRLLEMIADEDDIESIEGRYFDIHCLGEGFKRQWKLRALSEKQVKELTENTRENRRTNNPEVADKMKEFKEKEKKLDKERIEKGQVEKESFKPTMPKENGHKPKLKEDPENIEEICGSIEEMEKKAQEMEKKKTRKPRTSKKDTEKVEKA